MSTLTSGGDNRTDISSRTVPDIKDDAKYGRIKTVTSGITMLTGSDAGSSGFIVQTAGQGVLTPTEGDEITLSSVCSTKTLYEIGVKRISGSCTVHVIY